MSTFLNDFPIPETECIGDSLITINNGFAALDTAALTLSSTFTAAYACERNGVGAIGQYLAYGNGASDHTGLLMPYSGQIIAATLQGTDITGTITVEPCINGVTVVPSTLYRLVYTSADPQAGENNKKYNTPISFNAGQVVGWQQVSVPSSGRFNVNYLVRYFL